MLRAFLKFAGITMVTMIVSYFVAGLVARFVLGGDAFYPPSPTAISYLRDPSAPGMALIVWPAQLLRGLLFGVALFPLRKAFLSMGMWAGGLAFGAVIFIVGYVAASGGMIEHFVWFNEYPVRFAAITFAEILIQVLIMGPWTVAWAKRAQV
jgi:hypothetical protein